MSRAFALCTTDLEVYSFYLGIGKLITSITIKFYVLLYYIYRIRNGMGLQKNFGQKLV